MTEETKLLGTSGKETIPFEYQVEEQKIARQRAIAQAMLAHGMKGAPAPQMFGNHMANPGIMPHIANALAMYLGQKGLGQADEASAAMGQRMGADQGAEMAKVQGLAQGQPGQMEPQAGPPQEGQTSLPDIEQGGVKPDLKGAIAAAMQGKFGSTREYGTQLHKDNQTALMEQAKLLGVADPVAAIKRLQTGDVNAPLSPITQPPIEFGTDPSGNNYGATRDTKGGQPRLTYAPKPNFPDQNLTSKINEKSAEQYIPGGDLYKEAINSQSAIANNTQMLRDLSSGAITGSGAEYAQMLRKFGQSMGLPVTESTTPTELIKMGLGNRVVQNLGGSLGKNISDADRKMMEENSGNLATDPEALRRVLLLDLKGHNKKILRINNEAADLATRLPSGVALPQHELRFDISNDRDSKDYENLYNNRPFGPDPRVPKKPPLEVGPAGRIQYKK